MNDVSSVWMSWANRMNDLEGTQCVYFKVNQFEKENVHYDTF